MRTTQNTTSTRLHRVHSEQKVRADVVLGSPSANCGGVGICRVMAQGERTGISCPVTAAWISRTTEGKLRFEFDKSTMERRYMRRHFSWLLFQVFEPYTVPYSLLRYEKLAQRTIQPGIYQVFEAGNRLVVEF